MTIQLKTSLFPLLIAFLPHPLHSFRTISTTSCNQKITIMSQQQNKRKAASAFPNKPNKQSSLSNFFQTKFDNSFENQSSSSSSSTNEVKKIYVDLDGVLVDFHHGVQSLFPNKRSKEELDSIPSKILWSNIARCDNFYDKLPWTSDGIELWKFLTQYKLTMGANLNTNNIDTKTIILSDSEDEYDTDDEKTKAQLNTDASRSSSNIPQNDIRLSIDILTGVPMSKTARDEKARWCARELTKVLQHKIQTNHVDMAGSKQSHEVVKGRKIRNDILSSNVVNVITCWSRNKHYESGPGAILIDDREKLAEAWEEKGGIFIHHTSTSNTIKLLKKKCGISID